MKSFTIKTTIKTMEKQTKIIEIQMKADKEKHEYAMEELKYARATIRLKHELELERGRIKSAEIRKSQTRKEQMMKGDY